MRPSDLICKEVVVLTVCLETGYCPIGVVAGTKGGDEMPANTGEKRQMGFLPIMALVLSFITVIVLLAHYYVVVPIGDHLAAAVQ